MTAPGRPTAPPTASEAYRHAARLLVEAEAALDNPMRSEASARVAEVWTVLGDSLAHLDDHA